MLPTDIRKMLADCIVDQDHDRLVSLLQRENDAQALSACLWQAIGHRNWFLAERLEKAGATLDFEKDKQFSLLYLAIQDFGDAPEAIDWLLRRGADLSAVGLNQMTALHLAASHGFTNVIQKLINSGADINASTSIDGGWTPLMEACARDKRDAVEILVRLGADTAIRNRDCGTAKEIAQSKGYDRIVRLLLKHEIARICKGGGIPEK